MAQKLRSNIAVKLAQMVRVNRTRLDFLEEFQKMIKEYNSGAANIETFFARLMAFTQKLSGEERRGIAGEVPGFHDSLPGRRRHEVGENCHEFEP